ncbi:hypothetical protein YC2023_034395 [Brassica napus]
MPPTLASSSITTAGGPPALTPAPPSKLMFMTRVLLEAGRSDGLNFLQSITFLETNVEIRLAKAEIVTWASLEYGKRIALLPKPNLASPLIVVTSSWRQEKKTRKMHISFCETPSNVSVNDSELKSDVSVYDEFDMFYINIVVVGQDDSGKSTDTGHLIDKLHGLGSFRPPSTTALSLLLLNILISSRTWLVVPPRMIVLFLSLTPPLMVSKLVSLRMDRPMSTLSLLHP